MTPHWQVCHLQLETFVITSFLCNYWQYLKIFIDISIIHTILSHSFFMYFTVLHLLSLIMGSASVWEVLE